MRVAIIGCGAIARRGHIPALRRLGYTIVAVADSNRETAKRVSNRFGIGNYFSDYLELLNLTDIDIVVIATPPSTHSDIAVACAEAGKNIVIEKPLAMNVKECIRIRGAVQTNRVQLSIMQNWRYSPSLISMKKKLGNGEAGQILSFSGIGDGRIPLAWSKTTWRFERRGVLLDFFPHLADALLWLLDSEAAVVDARGGDVMGSSEFVNLCNMLVVLENGVSGFLTTSWLAGVPAFTLEIRGTGGTFSANALTGMLTEKIGDQTPLDDMRDVVHRTGAAALNYVSGNFFSALKAYEAAYVDIERGFAKGMAPVPLDDGLRTVALIEGASISLEKKRAIEIVSLL
jgi:predicted dehydrogenase